MYVVSMLCVYAVNIYMAGSLIYIYAIRQGSIGVLTLPGQVD
jgi:hypothetical protein